MTDALESGIVRTVVNAAQWIGAEDIDVVCLEKPVARLFELDRRVRPTSGAEQADAFAENRDALRPGCRGSAGGVNQAFQAVEKPDQVRTIVHHDL